MKQNHPFRKGVTKARIVELEKKERHLARLISLEIQTPFVEKFKENLGVILALTPYDEWPAFVRTCAEHAAMEVPMSWGEYKANLPKSSL